MTTVATTTSATRRIACLAVSGDTLTCVDHVRTTDGAQSFVDKHTLMTSDKAAASAALKELDIMLKLQPHAATGNVVKLHSFRLDKETQRLHILMEHCERGDLFSVAQEESRLLRAQLLAALHGLTTCERSLRRLTYQTLRGLRTLHRNDIAHMDLSLENVFLTAKGDVRIGDFALAQRFQRDDHGRVQRLQQAPHIAKAAYAAPELFITSRPVQDVTKADAWSLGVLLWHLATRSPLFPTGAPTLQDPVFQTIIQSASWASHHLPTASRGMRDLLVGLLDPNPATRLSIEAAMRHQWFTGKSSSPTPVASPPSPVIATTLSTKMQDSAATPVSIKMTETPAKKSCGRGRRDRTASAEISLEATRVAIRPSALRRV